MKKIIILVGLSLGLAACSGTWQGMKSDTSHNLEKTSDTMKKGTQAVGKGIRKTGEYLEDVGK